METTSREIVKKAKRIEHTLVFGSQELLDLLRVAEMLLTELEAETPSSEEKTLQMEVLSKLLTDAGYNEVKDAQLVALVEQELDWGCR